MSSTTDTLQKTYSSFADRLTDEKLDGFLKDSEAIMARPAALLLSQAGIDALTTKPLKLLDNACGTGVVGSQLQRIVNKSVLGRSSILCGDVNQSFLNILRRRVHKEDWISIKVETIDAQDSKLQKDSFTHVTISHGMHVIPKPDMVLEDTFRILQPGGIFAFSTMNKDNAAWVPDVRSAFATLPFEAALPDPLPMVSNGHLEWTDPKGIEEKLLKYGFEDVRVEVIQHTQQIQNAEKFVGAFAMMINWLAQSYWTAEQREKYLSSVSEHVAEHLQKKHGGDGWELMWTMNLVTCRTSLS
ncbi:putative S-adenosyl-L-methionine-dependent methyltransferase [Seiridium cardinale]|uniref:S-adenosyl-L-methionine-dependent methyltransferase n=1 Tax=Seiridium cardinale TaxID=138064 RepID=A0ABR2XSG7_9PEZI